VWLASCYHAPDAQWHQKQKEAHGKEKQKVNIERI
jgi:hypothetical protein